MNKFSPVAAAVLALGLAGAANAQLSIYGLIDASYGKSLVSDLAGDDADFHSGGDNGSSEGNSTTRFGIKGSTEVGTGIKANFALESGGITSDGEVNPGGAFFNRQAWLGFSGGFGEVRLGRQDSVAFQQMIDFDFNGASNGVSAGGYAAVGPWLPGRQSRSLQYITPDFGGLKVHVAFQPEGNVPDGKNNFAAAVKYSAGSLLLGAAYQGKTTDQGKNFYSLAGSYDFGVAKVMASYADGGDSANGGTGDGYMLGVVAPVAGFNVGAHYADNRDADVSSVELFVNREIFKNTYGYAEYGKWDNDSGTPGVPTSATGFAVGVIYVF